MEYAYAYIYASWLAVGLQAKTICFRHQRQRRRGRDLRHQRQAEALGIRGRGLGFRGIEACFRHQRHQRQRLQVQALEARARGCYFQCSRPQPLSPRAPGIKIQACVGLFCSSSKIQLAYAGMYICILVVAPLAPQSQK